MALPERAVEPLTLGEETILTLHGQMLQAIKDRRYEDWIFGAGCMASEFAKYNYVPGSRVSLADFMYGQYSLIKDSWGMPTDHQLELQDFENARAAMMHSSSEQ